MEFRHAREALKYLIERYRIKELYIPYYLCEVMRHAVFEVGCRALFYHIDDNFMPVDNFPLESYVLYPNYFGICSSNVDILTKKYPRMIVDNAHAYYAEPSGFASFNSAKKFLQVAEGATLWIGSGENKVKKDYERRKQFMEYHKLLKDSNLLKIDLGEEDVPFCYPYLAESIETADRLVKELTGRGLVVYRYWNNLPESYNEYKFYSRLVPVPLN